VPEHPHAGGVTRTRIIGLGNELLSDDGLGIRVVRELRKRLEGGAIDFEELSVGGLELLDHITGYERCIIVDAIATGAHPPGTVLRFLQTTDSDPVTLTSSHQIDLSQVLTLARLLGGDIPRTVLVYGIEAQDVVTFHDDCTQDVRRAIPRLVDTICADIAAGELFARPGVWQIVEDAVSDRYTTEHTWHIPRTISRA
jgi:hydrogenase maturation protease